MNDFDSIMQLSSETEIVSKLGRLIWRNVLEDEDYYQRLSDNERALACMYIFEQEMGRDGFYMFFYSLAGAYAYDTHAICVKIGAVKTAALIEKASQLFPVSPIPKNAITRRIYIERLDECALQEWDSLSDVFHEYEEDTTDLLIAYLKKQKAFL